MFFNNFHLSKIRNNKLKNKVVLAFSGGLDTSFCSIYLAKELNLEVHAVLVNTGGFSENQILEIEKHAQKLSVTSFECINVTEKYYEEVIKYLIFANVLKNNSYPLSVSAERILQAITLAEYAKSINADKIAHGSTGAGNDQVRFDLVFNTLIPQIEILTPIRDLKLSREAEIEYLKKHEIDMNFEKSTYSINQGLWGTSIGGKETLTSNLNIPENAWLNHPLESNQENIEIEFEKGEVNKLNGITYSHPSLLIEELNNFANRYAIGRDMHVGDTIIGIKGRVAFEAAAALIIIKAHHLLEKHTLTKWQLYWKDQLSIWYANWLHEGQFLDPTMRDFEAFFTSTQKYVSGKVFITLFPYRFVLNGIESENDLMSNKFGTYGETNNSWNGEDVKGFTKIFANQTSIFHQIHNSSSDN